jgi:hypothetical protein
MFAFRIRDFRSSSPLAGVRKKLLLTKLHRKKSSGVMSDERSFSKPRVDFVDTLCKGRNLASEVYSALKRKRKQSVSDWERRRFKNYSTLSLVPELHTPSRMGINVANFWDKAPCSSYVNRRFGGTFRHYLQGRRSFDRETSAQHVTTLYPKSWQHS